MPGKNKPKRFHSKLTDTCTCWSASLFVKKNGANLQYTDLLFFMRERRVEVFLGTIVPVDTVSEIEFDSVVKVYFRTLQMFE
jgi:hypothetical protein